MNGIHLQESNNVFPWGGSTITSFLEYCVYFPEGRVKLDMGTGSPHMYLQLYLKYNCNFWKKNISFIILGNMKSKSIQHLNIENNYSAPNINEPF